MLKHGGSRSPLSTAHQLLPVDHEIEAAVPLEAEKRPPMRATPRSGGAERYPNAVVAQQRDKSAVDLVGKVPAEILAEDNDLPMPYV